MNDEDTLPLKRRAADEQIVALTVALTEHVRSEETTLTENTKRIASLEAGHARIEAKLDMNTEVTHQVRDILGTFKTLGSVAKWLTAIAGAVAAIFAAIKAGGRP